MSSRLPVDPRDYELLARWRGGDLDAGNDLFERYFKRLYEYFSRKVEAEAAKDLVQKTWVACVERSTDIRDGNCFRSYLFSVAYNMLQRHFRAHYRKPPPSDLSEINIVDAATTPTQRLARKFSKRILLGALRRLEPEDQVVLELQYWEGRSREDIGSLLGLSLSQVRYRIRRAKQRLESILGEMARDPEFRGYTTVTFDSWCAAVREESGIAVDDDTSESGE